MISFTGIAQNITGTVIGRISYFPVKQELRHRTVLIGRHNDLRKSASYAAVLFSEKESFQKAAGLSFPSVFLDKGIELLADRDVIEVLPNGRIHVLYEMNSLHNVIFVTSRCNSKCIMCPQPVELHEGSLLQRNLDLISLIDSSTTELALTGGEPTIIGDDLFRLIVACKALLPATALLLLTNARKFSDFEYTHFFSSLKHPDMTIGTALYSDNEDEHDFVVGLEGAFNETVKGILNLATFDNKIEVRTVLHRYTYQRLMRMAEFIYRNMPFVKQFAIMGLETVGMAKDNLSSLWLEPAEMIDELEESIHYMRQRGMSISIYNIPLCLLPTSLRSYARQSISEWKNSFAPECSHCSARNDCSGLFSSGVGLYRRFLKPIKFTSTEEN